jgi:hypothetical protein
MEEWLPIHDNPQYAISNLGNVKNRLTDKLLKVYPCRLMTIRRMNQHMLRRIGNYLSQSVMIPVVIEGRKRRVRYYVDDLKHAYNLARVLLENNNQILYIE